VKRNSGQWSVVSGQQNARAARRRGLLLLTDHWPLATGHSRRGFTLLEVLLAMLLGIMLMAGLYFTMTMSLQQTQTSRDSLEIEDVSRAVFGKVSGDLTNILGPAPPNSGGTAPGGASAPPTDTSGAPAPTPTPTGTDPAPDPMTDPMTDPAPTEGTEPTETVSTLMAFQTGVIGGSDYLSIFASRVPGVLSRPGALNLQTDTGRQQRSDLVRIDYWVREGGGLCRKERPWVTADAVGATEDIDKSTEERDVISEEVTGVRFEYLDSSGTDAGSWGPGSATPAAPPRAVRVTLDFTFPNPRGGDPIVKTVSQVIVVRTSPGSTTPELIDPVAPAETTTEPMTESGASSTSGGGASGGGASGGGTSGGGASGGGAKGGGASGGGSSGGGAKGGGTSGGGGGGTKGGGGTGGGGTKGGGGGGTKGGRGQ
jgi:hypothetical protein